MQVLLKAQETAYIYELSTANFVHLQFKHANKHWLYILHFRKVPLATFLQNCKNAPIHTTHCSFQVKVPQVKR